MNIILTHMFATEVYIMGVLISSFIVHENINTEVLESLS